VTRAQAKQTLMEKEQRELVMAELPFSQEDAVSYLGIPQCR